MIPDDHISRSWKNHNTSIWSFPSTKQVMIHKKCGSHCQQKTPVLIKESYDGKPELENL
jgi:hypothetical protein